MHVWAIVAGQLPGLCMEHWQLPQPSFTIGTHGRRAVMALILEVLGKFAMTTRMITKTPPLSLIASMHYEDVERHAGIICGRGRRLQAHVYGTLELCLPLPHGVRHRCPHHDQGHPVPYARLSALACRPLS